MVSSSTADPIANTAFATADITNLSLLGLINLAGAHVECTANTAGASSKAQASGLTLLGLALSSVPAGNIPPNTTVQQTNILGQNIGYITYHEQTVTNNNGQWYVSATAVHIVNKTASLNGTGTITDNLELGHVECGSTQLPTVTAISPATGPESGGNQVTVTGTNFANITGVKVGAANAPSYTVDPSLTSMTVVVPAGTGVKDLIVTNAAGASANTAADNYAYVAKPTITAVNPNTGPASGGTSVVITGTNFTNVTAVSFGSTAATSYVVNNATQITAVAPARAGGTVDVRVTALGGTSDPVSADEYTFVAAPTVTNLSPNAGPLTAGTPVVITGTNFIGVTAVKFGSNTVVSPTIDSPTQITAIAPAGAAGTVNVTVTALGGTSTMGGANQYTYTAAPSITSVAPTSGPTTAGTSVVISGTNLLNASAVKFGATPAVSYTVNSNTQITATAPAGSAGKVDVTVTTPGGTSANTSGDDYTYVITPTVTAVSPSRGPLAGGTTVVITGTNFTAASSVKFGPTNATSFVVNGPTQITAVAPARAAGVADITVTTGGGTSPTSSVDEYTYMAAPTVTNVSPAAGPTAGGTSVTVTGTNFTGATSVTFGGTAGTSLVVISDTQLTISSPARSASVVDVVVTAPGGTSAITSADQYTYFAAPTVTGVSPALGPTTAGTAVTITGTNLTGATVVAFGPNNATGVSVNAAGTQITATAPAGSGGTVDVRVTTPGGTSPNTAADDFTYYARPTVASVSPAYGPLGGGTTVIITGTSFTPGATVSFGSNPATGVVFNSSTSLTAVAPLRVSAGTVDVTVTDVGGTSLAVSTDEYTYVGPPTVTAVSPNAGPLASGNSVVITGTGFINAAGAAAASAVKFGAANAVSYSVDSATQITAVAPAGSAGTVNVTVTAVGGTSATGSANQYTYTAAPSITSVAPASGPTTAGTSVVITGTNLLNASAVKFGALNAVSYTVNSATQITAVAPAGGAGTVDVAVTTVGGTSANTSADDYTYLVTPTVTAVSPNRGPLAGGTTVVITGTGFVTGASTVKFGSTNATSVVVNSNTQITAVAPARAAGLVDVTVTTAGGTSATSSADGYNYVAAPSVTSVSPTVGPTAGGTSVTVTGANFTGATAVTFGGVAGTSIVVSTDSQLTVTAPAHAAGTVDVVVTAPGGSSAISSADQFSYFAAPTVTAVSPSSGPTIAGTPVVITGTNFINVTSVKFGNTVVSANANSSTQITATAPAGTAGSTVDVTVTAVGGTSATSAADQYTFVALPTVTGIAPVRGPLAGGTTVVITGTGFTGASAVSFGGTAATSYTVNSATQITAVAPASSAGVVHVTVTTVGGTSATSSADQYTYVLAPTVTGVSPNVGPIAGGTSITVTGTNFTGATGVTIGGTAATGVTVSSDTQLVITSPAHAAGLVDVIVTAPGGTSVSSAGSGFTYYGIPTVTAISPASGPTTAGTTVTITGTNLTAATAVKFGANAAGSFTVNSATQITATAPSGSPGTVDVTVTTPGGITAITPADQYTYVTAPTVAVISPTRGPLGGGNSVVITGSNLLGATAVKIGAANATSYTVNNSNQITAVAPAGSLGTVDVTVTTAGGTSAVSTADQYTYVGLPTVTAVSPSTGPTAGGTTVTVTGTGFTGATAVSFGGVPGNSIAVSTDTQLTVVAPAQAAGTVDVTVTAPGGVSATSAADRFTYVAPPVVTGLSPSSGPFAGSLTQVVTITGTGFTGATGVTFDGVSALQILSVTPTQIQVRGVPPHATGPVYVQVTTPYGTSGQVPAAVYTYQGLPTLTAISPNSGPTAGGNSVVLTGTGFTTATSVQFGSNAAGFTVNSDTQITATVPAGSAGAVNVTVTTLYGLTGGSNPLQYTYVAAPAVSSVSPVSGPVAGGTLVTVTGTGFTGATAVRLDGVAATGVTVSSDTQITAFTPTHAAGTVDVSVTTVGGTTSLAGAYTYIAVPVVSSIVPSSGPTSGGTSVVITGTAFSGASAVSFGGNAATSYTVNSATQVTAVAPAGLAGTVDVRVTTVGGTSAVVAADRYTYVAAPAVTAVTPQAGPLAGGNTVIVTGTDFAGASAVLFGGNAAPSYTVNSATQITAVAPVGSAGTVDIRVTTVGGTSAVVAADRYSYQAVPSISGLSPTYGPVAGGTLVTLTGSGFSGATAVTFDGVPAAGVIAVNSDSQIIAQAPAHVAGVVNVVVTAPGGTSAGASYRYVGTPTVSGLAPVNGPISGGTTVVITGTGFATASGAAAVQFGGLNAASYTVNSDTQITAVTPAHAAGAVGVTISTADGGTSAATAASTFTYIAVPTVTSITPGSGPEAGGTSVVIIGTALSTASSVRFGGVAASFTVNSDTQITAVSPPGSGLVDVVVTTVGGNSATSAADRFRYVGAPTVTGLSPSSGPVAGGTSVTITGTQFYGVTGVSFGGSAATFTVASPTEITATSPSHAAGAVAVLVTTTDGGTSAAGQNFTYVADPVVTGLNPTTGPAPGGTTVVISGSGFSGATAVKFGSTPAASFTVNSSSQITAVSPAGSVGTVDVTVTGQFATSATSSADQFTYVAGPTITSVTPASGPLAGTNTVTIAGTGFTLNSGVTFGGVAATSVQYVSPTQLTAVVPAAGAGQVDVVVTTPYGQDTLVNGYRYRTAPSVTGLNPSTGPEAGGTSVTITGTGFDGATAVRFGAVPATLFTVSTDNSITATAPAGSGVVDVTVTGPGGTSTVVVGDRYRYAPVPVLAGISPTFGPTAGGTVVTLSGSGFTAASSVTVNGAAVGFTVNSDSTITLTTPGGTGTVPIVVTTPGGTTAAQQFTYANAPTISSLSPDRGPLGGGTSVTIDGTGFTSGSSVTFGGSAATSVQFVSSTRLTAVTPATATAGPVTATVTTAYGSASSTYRYVQAPTVTAVQPGAGPLAGGTAVTITGTGFTETSVVQFGSTPATSFTVNSDTSISAVAPARPAGAVDVTVTTPGGTSATSAADQFTYLVAPSVITLSPSSGPISGGTSVTITGTGFTAASAVTFGGVAAASVSYVSPTELQAVSPSTGSAGPVLVRVTTAGGADSGLFTYRDAPTVTQIQPGAGPEAGGTTVVITGSDFSAATQVRFGAATATFTVDSNTRITATAPAGTGTVDIRVTGPGGTSAVSPADRYRYAPVPAVNTLSPTFGPTAGGTSLTLSGSGFTGATTLTVSGASVPFTVVDDSTITVTTPAGTAGNAAVVVVTPGGTSAPIQFLYADAPTVSSLTPTEGPLTGGTAVTITGTDFTAASAVTFGGLAASAVTFSSPTQLVAVSPPKATSGPVNVVVTTAYGASGSGITFTYRDAPTVTSVSPTAGPEAGGTLVTITGTGFTGATNVRFGSAQATGLTVSSDTQITVFAPAGTGTVDVLVTAPGGTSAPSAQYRYAPVPLLSSLSPNSGPVTGGTSVTLTGSGFTGASGVTIAGSPNPFSVVNDTTITLTTPAHSAGNTPVVVTTPGGSSAPVQFLYVDAPTVSAISPDAGPLGGGTTVTITGTDLTAASAVTFGGVAATSVQYVSPTQVRAVSPAKATAGTVNVVVSTIYGTSGPGNGFTYTIAPTVTTVSPQAGPVAGGTTVTISGSGLTGASSVTFDGVAAASYAVNNDSTITATTPPGAAGNAVVRVTTVGGSDIGVFRYASVPSVSTIAPTAGPEAGGTLVTITGSGFTGATSVSFGATVVTGVTVSSDTQITVFTPAGTGTVDVRVTAPGGVSAPGVSYRFVPLPAVAQISPNSGPVTGGTSLTLTGSGFTGASSVTIAGSPNPFSVVNDTTITLTTPAHAAGNTPVAVTTPGGTTAPVQFLYVNAPTVTSLSPVEGPLTGGTAVTIIGTDFTAASAVTFGGTAAQSVQYVSPTQLTAVTPVKASAGPVNVVVTTIYGASGPGNTFTYRDAPTVTSIVPTAGPEAGGTLVTITGTGFTGATNVRFGSAQATGLTVSSDTQITVFAPAGTGTVDVLVTAPGGTSVPSAQYRYAPVPTVSQISPSSGPVTGGTAITLTGSGFTGASSVTIDGSSQSYQVVNDSTITLTTPAHPAGNTPVVVTTPGGTTTPVPFLYVNAPTVSAISPDAGPLSGGTTVTLTGTDFTAASAVTFGGVAASSVQYVSATQIRAVSPAKATAGAVNVVVNTIYGTSGPGNTFTYTNAPTVTSVSPQAGPLTGGTTVTISGSGLTGASSVTFDGVAATSYTVNNDSTITATTPPGSAGNAVVRVATVGGSDIGVFRYANVPTVSAVSPLSGPEAGGTLVTITGTGFTGATSVSFGSTVVAGITVSSDTQISVFAPAGNGMVDVLVTTPGGTSAPSAKYRYAPVPTINQMTPDSGPITGGTAATLTGTGFTAATSVTIDGSAASFTVVDSATITLTTPAHAAGTVPVVVTTPGGTTTPAQFRYVNAPTITAISPNDGPLGGGTNVTVTGADFTPDTTVTFAGTSATQVQYVSSTELVATSPAHTPAGTVNVLVNSPYGISSPAPFTYRNTPVITSITPRAGPEAGGTSVTITGTDFAAASSVRFGANQASFTVDSNTQITATTPTGTGTSPVTVVTPGGTSVAEPFRYAPVPAISQLTPTTGPLTGGTLVTVSGNDFTDASSLTIDGSSVPCTVVNASTITFTTPAGTAGTKNVAITTPGGQTPPAQFRYVTQPTIATVTPAAGPIAGGTTVTIAGSNLTDVTTVTFGGTPATTFTIDDANTITATTPPGSAGTATVQVTSAGGNATGTYRYANVPTITQLQPSAGPEAGGTAVTITGTGFTGATNVRFGAVPATFTVVSNTEITATTPPGTGTSAVTVQTPGGTAAATQYRYAPVPTVSSPQPQSGPLGGGTTVTLTGSGFTGTSTVTLNGSPIPFTVVDDSTITFATPAGTAGSKTVAVTTPGGSASTQFQYVNAPAITNLQSDEGPLTEGTLVTITGTGFNAATVVDFGGTPATSFVVNTDTEITARAPAHSAGVVDVRVTGPGGTSGPAQFTYRAVPQITGLSPSSGPITGGTVVTLTGSGFTGAGTVTLNNSPIQFTVVNDSTITFTTPAGSAGTAPVAVSTVGGTATASFTYANGPTVTALTPTAGPLSGGTAVTISGTGFTLGSAVSFGADPAASVQWVNPTEIVATTPISTTPGSVDVVVTTIYGNSGTAGTDNDFTYTTAPVITSLQPNQGPIAGGNTVTITGLDFSGATGVSFGTTPATSFFVSSDTEITAVVPAHAVGTVDVRITSPGGTSAAGQYTYLGVPTVVSLSPDSGPVSGGTSVTITGTGFTPTSTVTFGGTSAGPVQWLSATKLVVDSPAKPAGATDVVVTTLGGSSGPGNSFDYQNTPTISALTPDRGPLQGTTVTITGANFTQFATVKFGSTPAGPVQFVSVNQLIVPAPPSSSAGPVDVEVTTAGGTSAPETFAYVAAPTIGGIQPSSGPIAGGTSIVITGTGFTGAAQVSFGSGLATSFTVDSDTQITAVAPAVTTATAVNLTVGTVGGTSNPVQYTYRAAPQITGLSPDNGPAVGGTVVTINGSGFTGTTTVTLDGGPIPFTVVSDTEITFITPAGPVGPKPVTVRTPGGSAASTFDFRNLPVINSITPNTGPLAGGGAVAIEGSGFTGATALRFGLVAATSWSISNDTTITAIVPQGISPGQTSVTLTGPGGISPAAAYTYVARPTISEIAPASGPVGGGTSVIIRGDDFSNATGVLFDGIPASSYTVQGPQSIVAVTPSNAAGPADVVVTTAGGDSDPGTFTYIAVPLIAVIEPDAGPTSGGTDITINGSGLADAAVTVDGEPVSHQQVSSNQLLLQTPPHPAGPVDITVTTVAGVASSPFTYVAPPSAPVLSLINPASGPLEGGQNVTLTGVGFTDASAVNFGDATASFTVSNDTTITAAVPPGDEGAVRVSVSTPNGVTSEAVDYVYVAPTEAPTITGVTPQVGPVAGGTRITITGTGFDENTTVAFDGTPGTDVRIGEAAEASLVQDSTLPTGIRAAASTTLTVLTPAHAEGPATVEVTNSAGSASAEVRFTFIPLLENATISMQVPVNTAMAVAPQGSLFAGLRVQACTIPNLGTTTVGTNAAFCRYTAPAQVGLDSFTMQVTDALGQQASQGVRITVTDSGEEGTGTDQEGGNNEGEGTETDGDGDNNTGGEGTGTDSAGGNDDGSGTGSNGGNTNETPRPGSTQEPGGEGTGGAGGNDSGEETPTPTATASPSASPTTPSAGAEDQGESDVLKWFLGLPLLLLLLWLLFLLLARRRRKEEEKATPEDPDKRG
nr:IPT/TIG domain-containing protein [Kineosporia babensis]